MSFPLDAEDEDTSLLDRALAFLWAQKRDALKKRVQTLFSIRGWKAIWVSSAFNASQAFDIFFFVTGQKRFIRLKKGQKNKTLAARQQGFDLPCYHSTRGSYRSHMTVLWKSHGTILEKIRSHRSCMKVTRKSHDATTLFYHSSELSSFWYKKQQKYIGIVEKTSLSILLGKIKSATLMCKIKIALSKLSEKTFLVNDLLSEQNPLTHLKIGW